jgi:hypothetical protein
MIFLGLYFPSVFNDERVSVTATAHSVKVGYSSTGCREVYLDLSTSDANTVPTFLRTLEPPSTG